MKPRPFSPSLGSAARGVALTIRAPATRTFPCRRPSVGNRRLYTLAPPAADPFVGPRVYPVSTPCRPPPESGRQIFMSFIFYLPPWLCMMWKTSFFTVFRGLRRRRLAPNRAPVVSVMRAARTGLIDISFVLGTEVAQHIPNIGPR